MLRTPAATARVVAPHVLHVVAQHTLFVLTLPAVARCRFTAVAAACALHHPARVLVSVHRQQHPHHVVALVQLPSANRRSVQRLQLPSQLASEHEPVLTVLPHSFSHVHAMCAEPSPTTCACRLLLFTARAVAQLCVQSQSTLLRISQVKQCDQRDANALKLVTRAPRNSSTNYVVVTRSGAVHFVDSLRDQLPTVPYMNLFQTAVSLFLAADDAFVTIVGCFRRVLSIAFDASARPFSNAILLPRTSDAFKLSPFCYQQLCTQANALYLQPTPHHDDVPLLHIRLITHPDPHIVHTVLHPSVCSTSSQSKPLIRPLLHAIDRLSLRTAHQSSHEADVQNNLSTTLHMLAAIKASPVPLSVTLSMSQYPQGHVPNFYLSQPPRTKHVYVIVHLKSTHTSSLSSLSLRVCVSPYHPQTVSKLPVPDSCLPRERAFVAPLPTLSASETTHFSFPLFLGSHAPLKVSVSLLFDVPNEDPLQLALHEQLLDVLSFSTSTTHVVQDASTALFALPFAKPHQSTMQHSRLCVPYSINQVRSTLGVGPEPKHFQTLLGASFSVLASDTPTCVITIRAPTHVTPFVRAALLRRLVRTTPQAIVVKGMSQLRSWRSAVTQSVRRCDSHFSDAEHALVEAVAVFERLQNGDDGDGVQEWKRALTKAVQAYRAWRREGENVWTLGGTGH
eukprot:TRINITY_DN2945_c0_g1_i1.p1 TRINITY_DN2945_c0_g1~~TRINITY_DN2945_c0_g1_i1.p1  ORF type:complete len:678 (+),score=103.18 TRINITY_DN2945_c0_g1_i1:1818-3851(+)